AFAFLVTAEAPGLLERITVNQTPRSENSRHLWYRCSEPVGGNTELAVDPEDKETGKKKEILIETRGEGGLALIPGCPAECHPTGRLYVHVSGPPLLKIVTITSEERELLHRIARSFDLREQQETEPREVKRNGTLLPGDDFNARGPSW